VWYYTFGSDINAHMVQVSSLPASKQVCSKPTEVSNNLSAGWPQLN